MAVVYLFASADTETIFTDYEPYLPHALAVAALLHQRTMVKERAGHLLYLLAHYLIGHARYEQAEILCLDALWLYEQLVGPAHHEIGAQLNHLALLYDEKREHTKAQRLFEQALAIAMRTHPPQPLAVATALGNLGRCFRFQGKVGKAKELAQQALMHFERATSASQEFASVLILLASILRDQGDFSQATTLYQRAHEMYENLVAPDHVALGYSFEAQGTLHFFEQAYEQATLLYQKALTILESHWGKNHPDVASCLCRLAKTYLFLGQLEQAEKLNKRALSIYETIGGPAYLEINQPLQGLALQYGIQRKYGEAEQLCQQAMSIIEKSQGYEHADMVEALRLYANLRFAQEKFQEASQLMDNAEALEQKLSTQE